MKKILISSIFCALLLSCSGNDNVNENCNFLLNIGVNAIVNLNLPQFSQLLIPANSAYVPNAGNGGVIVTNTGTGFVAWDAADPNHAQSNCSFLNIVGGIQGVCNCAEENTYSLITGQPLGNANLQCGLKFYQVQQSGSDLLISN
jgi:nitrite reductase/ring-hydroxylating ferredoxin subunit